MKTLKQEWLDRAKEAGIKDPDPNVRMCQAFAHFDGPGWTKFNMAALIIDLSEQIDKWISKGINISLCVEPLNTQIQTWQDKMKSLFNDFKNNFHNLLLEFNSVVKKKYY